MRKGMLLNFNRITSKWEDAEEVFSHAFGLIGRETGSVTSVITERKDGSLLNLELDYFRFLTPHKENQRRIK